ncbi:MAG TPA: hypothetical protein VF383_11700 [Candidatus Dormibacteraeota bacterium]
MKVTIALLVIYVLTLVIEVPIGLYTLIKRYGAATAIGPGAIEAIFVALMITFIFYGGRGMRWSYVGAVVVGIVHAIFSAAIVLMEPWGEPLDFFVNYASPPELIHRASIGLPAVAAFLTVLPALLAIAAALAVLELRRRAPS